jgi:hypothetical protein
LASPTGGRAEDGVGQVGRKIASDELADRRVGLPGGVLGPTGTEMH